MDDMEGEKNKSNFKKVGVFIALAALMVVAAFFCGYGIASAIRDLKEGSEAVADAGTEASSAEQSSLSQEETENSSHIETETDKEAWQTKETVRETEKETEKETDMESAAVSDELSISVGSSNGWGEAPDNFVQLDIRIENQSERAADGWKAEISVGDCVIDQSWSCGCEIKDGVLIITPAEYNSLIAPKNSADIGVIVKGATGDFSARVFADRFTDMKENQGQQNQGNQNNQGQQNQGNSHALEVPAPSTDDWLHTDGRRILDADGNEVWLTGINWFGYNTGTNTFDGLWACDLNTSLQAIADHGFNLLRIPISAELLLQWKNGEYPSANFNQATNFYLVGMNSLEIFDYIIDQCRANGIHVMIDIHCAKTDASGHTVNLWYNGDITTQDYLESLSFIAQRYKDDDTILAYDLKNEPHGKPYENNKAIWNDSEDENNWKHAAELAAMAVLDKNPNALVMVEGTEIYPVDIKTNGNYSSTDEDDYYFNWWGGNLRGVRDYPVNLGKYQDKLVYSPHDYGPAVYNQPWFYSGYNYDSLMKDCWEDNWFYIYEDNIAPLLIGEWGGFMKEPNLTWMTHMRTLIKTYRLNHTFWCFNANSGDTGGIVKDDFVTWDDEKYEFVKEVLWQENGKFVGLDHEIPLGTQGNGISLGELYK